MASRTKSIRQFSDDSLVWGGWMYHNPKKRSEKTEKKSEKRRFNKSHKYWCELHREACFYPRELRFYAKRRNGFQQKDEKVMDTVPLKNDVIKVIPGIEYGIPESFKIVTSKAIYIFGTTTPEEAQSWSYAIWKELYGPVEAGIVYNFNVEVEQNRTTQKYNIMGSYLLKVYDDQIKLFAANGKIPTRFKAWVKDIVKASSPPVLCLSLAVLNISTSDVGGDVMVFYADSARDIVKIINHRRHIILGTTSDIEMPQEPILIDLPINKYTRSQSQPRHLATSVKPSVNKNSRSKTNPLKAGSAYIATASSSPKYHLRKSSAPFRMFNNINQGNNFELGSQSVSDATHSAPDRHGGLTMRPPAPLPRSQASLHHTAVPEPQQFWSSRNSISSTDSDSSSGYVIDSLVRNSYLKLCSSLSPLDIVYMDPQLDVYTLRRSYHGNSDGESNYSDSELWLSTRQKRFSRKSKRLSQRLSQRSSTVSHPRSISELTLNLGSDISDNLPILKNKVSPRKMNSATDVDSADVVKKSQSTMFPSSLIPKRFHQEYDDTTAQSRSDPKLNRSNVGRVHVHRQEDFGKEATKESDNESNYSDGELWLCAEQKRFLRRSKRMSNKENQKKSPTIAPIKPKIKPPIVPKPNKRHFAAGSHAGLGRSVSHDDQRLQNETVIRKPLTSDTGSVDNAANEIVVSGEHHYCVIRNMQHIPLPELPLVSIDSSNSKTICPVRKYSHDMKSIADNNGDSELNQSDSELMLSNVQREFSRRSKKLSSKKRNLQASQSNSTELDEGKTKSSNSKGSGSPTKFKPQVIPRTITKPIVPTRKTAVGGSSDTNKETSPHQTSSPNSVYNPDQFWANTTVDQIASNIASSLLDTHMYSKVTNNGALPSLPIPIKRNPHLNLSLKKSGSFDDSYSPDHMYNYPYDDSWINNGEEAYNSDSDIWFGKELRKLSQRCKRISRNSKKLRAQQTPDNTDVTSLKQKATSGDEGTAVKTTKPRTSPRLLKPEARPRKVFKQEESSISTSDSLNDNPMKSSHHDHHRKRSDELPVLPTTSTPILISNLNWSADEDKTYLVNSAMAACEIAALEDSEEENSGSGYVINTLDCNDDSVYLELESSNHIYSQPIFPMDGIECKIINDKVEVSYMKTQEMVK